jgi:hypothetical protein
VQYHLAAGRCASEKDTARYGTRWSIGVQKSPPSLGPVAVQSRPHLHNYFTNTNLSNILPSTLVSQIVSFLKGFLPNICRIHYLLLPLFRSHHSNLCDHPNTIRRRLANYENPHHVIFSLPTYTFLIQTGRGHRHNSLPKISDVDYIAFI